VETTVLNSRLWGAPQVYRKVRPLKTAILAAGEEVDD